MVLIVCVANNMGLTFNNRRVSRDKLLIENVIDVAGNRPLYMNSYSKELFESFAEDVMIEDEVNKLQDEDIYYFYEKGQLDINPDKIYLYKWNRDYPGDEFFELDLQNYQKQESIEFEGNSHKKITRELWIRK